MLGAADRVCRMVGEVGVEWMGGDVELVVGCGRSVWERGVYVGMFT